MNTPYEHHFTWLDRINSGGYAFISESLTANTAVVFVHGFLGDAEGTWLNFQEMIDSCHTEYQQLAECDFFFFAYPSFFQEITDSAEQFLKFIAAIYPTPPGWLFSISKQFSSIPAIIDLDLPVHAYKNLILVGHSEGCIVIRRAAVFAYKQPGQDHPILTSHMLPLFAPAHLGFQPTGWIRACLAVGRIEAIVMPLLRLSPAFGEMETTNLLDQINTDTTKFWDESHLNVMRARVLFGKERIVVKGEFTNDIPENSEPGKNHVSICKPKAGYDRPIRFVIK
jgi:hypothetical protein